MRDSSTPSQVDWDQLGNLFLSALIRGGIFPRMLIDDFFSETQADRAPDIGAMGQLLQLVGILMQEAADETLPSRPTPESVVAQILRRNRRVQLVRELFPRPSLDPVATMLLCIDPRLHADPISGLSAGRLDVVACPGAAFPDQIQESVMGSLLVHPTSKVVMILEHDGGTEALLESDDGLAGDQVPQLIRALADREEHLLQFVRTPWLAAQIANEDLWVVSGTIDPRTWELKLSYLSEDDRGGLRRLRCALEQDGSIRFVD